MPNPEQEPNKVQAFDPTAIARSLSDHLDIQQQGGEDDAAFRSRIAGVLRGQGRIIEAHEALSGRRWDDEEQGPMGPMTGIIGALAQAAQGIEYSPHDPERQVGDDLAAGVVASSPKNQDDAAIGRLLDLLGPSRAMDVIDALHKPDPSHEPQ